MIEFLENHLFAAGIISWVALPLTLFLMRRRFVRQAWDDGYLSGKICAEGEKYWRGYKIGFAVGVESHNRLSVLEQRLQEIRSKQQKQ